MVIESTSLRVILPLWNKATGWNEMEVAEESSSSEADFGFILALLLPGHRTVRWDLR